MFKSSLEALTSVWTAFYGRMTRANSQNARDSPMKMHQGILSSGYLDKNPNVRESTMSTC